LRGITVLALAVLLKEILASLTAVSIGKIPEKKYFTIFFGSQSALSRRRSVTRVAIDIFDTRHPIIEWILTIKPFNGGT
jgi:hypothetical protein